MELADGSVDPARVGTRAEFAAAFTRVRENAGLSVRDLARRIGVPAGTLGGYFGGRHIPSVGQQGVVEAALRECGVGDDAVAAWLEALRRARRSSDGRTAPRAAPYRGLKTFEPDDAELFFGRAELTADILERLAALAADPGPSRGLLAVIGPSGSGKSSVLRAGVVAAVRDGALGPGWTCTVGTPAADGLFDVGDLPMVGSGRRVLVLDQFEEIFTYGAGDPAAPAARSRLLARLAEHDPQELVVLGMRADFYPEAAREPVLLAALQHAQVVVGPMTEDDVRAAIIGPAEHVGMTVDDGLVELVLADADPHDASGASHDVGALPLLSHALLATWERSTGRRMTVADYRATGGLDGAIQRTAEEVYTGLTPAEREVARRLFLRLVHLAGDIAVTRRRATPEELEALTGDGESSVRRVLERFVQHRLVTATASSVEISHEALLGAWPRLRSWVDADRAGLQLHRRLTDAANGWAEAGRDPGLLLRGVRLEAVSDWVADERNRRSLNATESAYLDASRSAREAEHLTERRRTRRLAQLLVAVAVLAVVATTLAVLARRAQNRAAEATVAGRVSHDQALSRQLAFQARDLDGTDPALAQQIAALAYRVSPTVEARSQLLDESTAPVVTRQLGRPGPTALAVRPDGRLIAVGDAADGSVHLRSASGTLPQVGVLPGDAARQVYALRFSPDGTLLAVGGASQDVTLWDVRSPARPRRLATLPTGFPQAAESVVFTPDTRTLLAAGTGPLAVWDISTPAAPLRLPSPPGIGASVGVQSLAMTPDGRRLAAGLLDGRVLVWSGTRATARPAVVLAPGGVNAVAFSDDGRRLAAGDRKGDVSVWSVTGARPRPVRRVASATGGEINTLAWSPDGRALAVGSADNTAAVWDTRGWTRGTATPHPGPVTGVDFLAGGRELVSTAADGAVRRWALQGPSFTVPGGSVFSVAFARRGRLLAIARNGPDGGVQLWRTGSTPAIDGPLLQLPGANPNDGTGALRRDGSVAAAADSTGDVELWNTAAAPRTRPVSRPFAASRALVESLAISPDGRVLAVGGDDDAVSLWSIADPAHPRRLGAVQGTDLMLGVAFSPDGRLLAGADADHRIYVWDVRSFSRPRRIAALRGFTDYAYGVAFSPDGRLLAGSGADHTVRLWSVHGTTRPPTPLGSPLTGPTDYVNTPAFSPDSRMLAAPSNDHAVWVYDVSRPAAPRRWAVLRALDGNIFTAAFSPDGRTLVAGGRGTLVPTWTVDPHRAVARECATAGTPITRREWREYVGTGRYDPPCR